MKVALYARVSSEKQAEKDLSIPAQLKAMREYALRNNYEVVQEFVDEAESARTANRPKFQEMIAYAKKKEPPFKAILVWKMSRFARNREDSIVYKSLLRRNGVQVISINEQIDDTPAGKMFEGIIEVLDEYYSANLAHDTIRGMKENAQQGYFNGGYVPYGYAIDNVKVGERNKRKWKINEEEAPTVQLIFELCTKGLGVNEIQKELHQKGIVNRKSQPFNENHLFYVLKNENYTGTYVWNRRSEGEVQRYPNHHVAIIDEATFQKARKVLAERAPKVIHPREVSSIHVLVGLIFCARCGSKMVPVGAKSGKFKYYICQSALKKGKHVCNMKMLNAHKFEGFVIDIIKQRLLTDENLTELSNLLVEELNLLQKEHSRTLPLVQKRIADIDKRIQRLYEAIEGGKLIAEDIAPRLRQLNADKEALLSEHKAREGQVGDWKSIPPLSKEEVAIYVEDLRNTLSSGSIIENKRFIRSFVKKICVNHPQAKIEYTMPLTTEKKREWKVPRILDSVSE